MLIHQSEAHYIHDGNKYFNQIIYNDLRVFHIYDQHYMTQKMYHEYIKYLSVKITISLLSVLRNKIGITDNGIESYKYQHQIFRYNANKIQHLYIPFSKCPFVYFRVFI